MIGAAIGSFLNVVIYRMPRLLSLGDPKHSFCPNCKHRLGMADLVPLFSWLTSGGKCRHCGEKVPSRYFWVELITGGLWAGIWYRYFCADWTGSEWMLGIFFMLATAALVAIIFIDGEHFIIPDEINGFLLFLGFAYAVYSHDWKTFAFGYLMGWGLLFLISFLGRIGFGKDAMGDGDVKMMRGIGSLLGPSLVVFDLMVAVVTGLVFTLIFMGIQSYRDKKNGVTPEEEPDQEPTPIKDVFILGVTYFFCFDIIALWWPGIYEKLGYPMDDVSVEDDTWVPEATALPFGPYLAIGAIVCMLLRTELTHYANTVLQALSGS